MCAASVCLFGQREDVCSVAKIKEVCMCVCILRCSCKAFGICRFVCLLWSPNLRGLIHWLKARKLHFALLQSGTPTQDQPLIIVCILLQMLYAKKPQHKHTLGVSYEGFLNQTWFEKLSLTMWFTMDYGKAIIHC